MSKKYAVVTGASSGIGGAIAIELSRAGYFVALVGRNQKRLEDIKSKVDAAGGGSRIFTADLNTFEGINKLIDEIKTDTKQIDVLVNAAAIWHGENEVFAGRDFDTFPQSVVSDTMMVGLMAPTLLAHAFVPLMPPKSKIINISGVFGDLIKGWTPYFVSKRAIEDLTIGLSIELMDKDIQVNAISPNDVATAPYKQYFPQYYDDGVDPAEIASFAVKLCSLESDQITGQIFVIAKDKPITEQFHA
jgi:NAD(P)-dependent dehydrogenase (short-subunit alcohol dehydrogenase family)